jgi:hypothetical protein
MTAVYNHWINGALQPHDAAARLGDVFNPSLGVVQAKD